MIIAKTYELLQSKYESRIKDLLIEDIRIGTFMSAVKLSDQSYGLASTLFDEDTYCGKKNRDFIGATRITHPELLFDVVGSGGKGYHLFRYCAEKISILPG